MLSSCRRALRLSLIVCLVSAPGLTAAQPATVITGVVSDQTGAAIAGARVELVPGDTVSRTASRTVATDDSGGYRFEGVAPGGYAVRVTAPGFQATERPVIVGDEATIAVDVSLAVRALEETVLVQGGTPDAATARATAALARIPGAVDVVADTQFENGPATTVKDVLGWVPGVTLQPRSNIDNRVSIRGSGLTRNYGNRGVNLYQDGIPINTADGLFDLFEVDPTAYRFVEVFKGANALRYGANALGGAVNFVTPTGRDAARGEARVDAGSFGSLRGQASTGGAIGRLDYFATGSTQREDGYREHSNGHMTRGSANAGYRFSPDAQTRVYVNANTWRQRLPGEVTRAAALASPRTADTEFVRQDQQRNIDSIRLASKTALRVGRTSVDLAVFGVRRHVDHPIYRYLDYRVGDYGGYAHVTDDRSLGGFRNRLVAGVNVHDGAIDYAEYENVGAATKGALLTSTRDRSRNHSAHVEDSLFLRSDLALIGGGQFLSAVRDRRDRLPADGDQSARRAFHLFNPRAGVVWDVASDWQVFGNVSRSAEVPTFDVSAFAAPADAIADAQTAITYELGSRGRRSNVTWDVAVYRARIRHELQCLTSSPYSPCTVVNADRTVHQGIEAGLGVGLLGSVVAAGDRVWLRATYTRNDFFFVDDPRFGGNSLPGVGPHHVRAEALYSHPSGFSAGPNVEWMPRAFFADNANSLTVPPFAVWNLRLAYDPGARWSCYVEGRNLGDARYISTTITAGTATAASALFNPGIGRSVQSGLRLAW